MRNCIDPTVRIEQLCLKNADIRSYQDCEILYRPTELEEAVCSDH